MAHNEHVLKPGETISVGQWLRSRNGLFQAIIQEDGNFCVYRGNEAKSALWSTMWQHGKRMYDPKGGEKNFYNVGMQEDGNLVIRKSGGEAVWASNTSPTAKGSLAILYDDGNFAVAPDGEWSNHSFQSGVTDRIDEGSVEVLSLQYDTGSANCGPVGPPRNVFQQIVSNDTDEKQYPPPTITGTYTKSEATTWKETTGFKVATKTEVTAGIPYLASAKIEVSAEVSQSIEFGQTTTTTEQTTVTVPVTVPPHRRYMVRAYYTRSQIAVPFKLTGMAKFDGYKDKLPIYMEGIFEGIGYDEVVTQYSDITNQGEITDAGIGQSRVAVEGVETFDHLEWHRIPHTISGP